MKIHKVSRKDSNTLVGRKTRCGLSDFFTTKETESKTWEKVTCLRCLMSRKKSKENAQ